MPALYWIEFYVDPALASSANVVAESVHALLDSGCRYKRVRLFTTQDTMQDHMHQRVTREDRVLDLLRAQELATNAAARLEVAWPDVQLIFSYPFEFDPEVRDKISQHGGDLLEEANEICLRFGPVEDPRIGRRICINITMFQEFVLMYGKNETHERNLQRILALAESIYNHVKPYFGWMDDETNSSDMSYDRLLDGKFPLANEFVFIGEGLIGRADLRDLNRFGHWNKALPDGGIVIRWAAKDRWDTE
ncbi:MAG TPA: hypothetical protein VEO20_07540 [Thermoplasmata archaeon]|nr:hypothetical protein [Thermoplasmata archaeon]